MEMYLDSEEIIKIRNLLAIKNIKISPQKIEANLSLIQHSQQTFSLTRQKALLVNLLYTYEHTRKKEVILLEEIGKKEIPVTIILGVLAEDWPGMSNSILGIVHHKERNVSYVRGFTFEYEKKTIGIVTLTFKLDKEDDYFQYLQEKKALVRKIREASQGSTSKYLLLDDEAIKFEIYNEIIKKILKIYHCPNLVKVIEESGEAIKFISSRSREYLEEREPSDLAKLIVDNYSYQNLVRCGYFDEVIKIKNFETKYEKLSGITFICREVLFSVEDFLKILDFLVPGHIIKHHKSFVTMDEILVYRVEIVDRDGRPLSAGLIKSLERSMEKFTDISRSKEFSKLKSVGGFEHYARAIIPFLMEELQKTNMNQVFFNVEKKTDFLIHIKLIVVSRIKSKRNRLFDLISRISSVRGIDIISSVPPKIYKKNTEVDILKLKVNLVEFGSVKEIYSKLKDIIRKIFGDIRDFDEGFREMYILELNHLLENLKTINPALVRDIFFSIDELYRIEIPRILLMEVIKLCSSAVEEAKDERCDKLIVKHKNVQDVNGTIILVSYEEHRKLLSKLIKKFKDMDVYFTKIEWNQRYYVLIFLGRGEKPISKKFIEELKSDIKKIIK
jgi:hypothetical protein